MKAMILAAGFGTRLKPLTDNLPKALIKYQNKTLLQYQVDKLKDAGIYEIVINTHHYPDKIKEYIDTNDFVLKEINVIKEDVILGTGGGILNAKKYFQDEDYFLVVNVDVHTNFEYKKIIGFHKKYPSFSTIAVQKRKTKRYLEFDDKVKLIGRENPGSVKNNLYAFNGIHVISGKIFEKNLLVEYCDIIDIYLKMINEGEEICGFDTGDSTFKDMGKIENLNG
jgi:N-acetyl-alpha-D-muramate 1-phosphate uridylyltransferase